MLTLFWKTNTKQPRIFVRLTCHSYSGISGLKRNDDVNIPLQYTPFHRKVYYFVLSNVMHHTVSFVVDISSEFLCLFRSRKLFPMQIDGEPWMQPPAEVRQDILLLTPSGLFNHLKTFSTGHISTLCPGSPLETLETRLVLFSGAIGQF